MSAIVNVAVHPPSAPTPTPALQPEREAINAVMRRLFSEVRLPSVTNLGSYRQLCLFVIVADRLTDFLRLSETDIATVVTHIYDHDTLIKTMLMRTITEDEKKPVFEFLERPFSDDFKSLGLTIIASHRHLSNALFERALEAILRLPPPLRNRPCFRLWTNNSLPEPIAHRIKDSVYEALRDPSVPMAGIEKGPWQRLLDGEIVEAHLRIRFFPVFEDDIYRIVRPIFLKFLSLDYGHSAELLSMVLEGVSSDPNPANKRAYSLAAYHLACQIEDKCTSVEQLLKVVLKGIFNEPPEVLSKLRALLQDPDYTERAFQLWKFRAKNPRLAPLFAQLEEDVISLIHRCPSKSLINSWDDFFRLSLINTRWPARKRIVDHLRTVFNQDARMVREADSTLISPMRCLVTLALVVTALWLLYKYSNKLIR